MATPPNKTFTRLNLKDPAANQALQDVNDKFSLLFAQVQSLSASISSASSTASSASSTPTVSAQALGGKAINISVTPAGQPYAFIPQLAVVPSNNPTTGAPYAQDGIVIEFSPSPGDSGVLFRYISGTTFAWQYMEGNLYRTQAQLSSLASLLGTVHTNMLVWVTDYAHMLQWNGSGWQRGPGDPEHSDMFYPAGAAPTDTGWHALDGSTGVSFLKYDGTTGTRDLPNITGMGGSAAFIKGASSYSATVTAATNPSLTINSYTPAGTNSSPALSMNPFTPAGTNSAPALSMNSYTPVGSVSSVFTGDTISISAAATFAVTGAATALTVFNGSTSSYTPTGSILAGFTGTPETLTGTVSAPTFTGTPATLTGSVAAPVFTGTAHTLTGSISLPDNPIASFPALLYYRQ